jgi:hypothetical protein
MLNKNMVIALAIFWMSIFLMSATTTSVFPVNARDSQLDVFAKNYAGPFFGINLPAGQESSAFIQNVT